MLVAEALRTADYRLLAESMVDRLHQLYRLGLFPGTNEMIQAARQAGAAAAVLSGAGSGVIAFAESGHDAIQTVMMKAATETGLQNRGFILRITNDGADGE